MGFMADKEVRGDDPFGAFRWVGGFVVFGLGVYCMIQAF